MMKTKARGQLTVLPVVHLMVHTMAHGMVRSVAHRGDHHVVHHVVLRAAHHAVRGAVHGAVRHTVRSIVRRTAGGTVRLTVPLTVRLTVRLTIHLTVCVADLGAVRRTVRRTVQGKVRLSLLPMQALVTGHPVMTQIRQQGASPRDPGANSPILLMTCLPERHLPEGPWRKKVMRHQTHLVQAKYPHQCAQGEVRTQILAECLPARRLPFVQEWHLPRRCSISLI